MHIAEVVTIAKSLPLLRLNTYKSLILSYSADYRRIFGKIPERSEDDFCRNLKGPDLAPRKRVRSYICQESERQDAFSSFPLLQE